MYTIISDLYRLFLSFKANEIGCIGNAPGFDDCEELLIFFTDSGL